MGTDTLLNQTNGLIFVNTIDTLLFKCGFSFVFALLCFVTVKKRGSCSGYYSDVLYLSAWSRGTVVILAFILCFIKEERVKLYKMATVVF